MSAATSCRSALEEAPSAQPLARLGEVALAAGLRRGCVLAERLHAAHVPVLAQRAPLGQPLRVVEAVLPVGARAEVVQERVRARVRVPLVGGQPEARRRGRREGGEDGVVGWGGG